MCSRFNNILFLVILTSQLIVSLNAQTLNLASNAVRVSWQNMGTYTYFSVTSSLNGVSPTNAWLGIGINTAGQMVIDSITTKLTSLFDYIFRMELLQSFALIVDRAVQFTLTRMLTISLLCLTRVILLWVYSTQALQLPMET